METEDTRDKAADDAQAGGDQLDEAAGKVGAAVEDTVGPIAEKVADKVVDATGGLPDS